jgi:hypothetical protein
MVYWGIWYALVQMFVIMTSFLDPGLEMPIRRVFTLLTGSLMPCIAMTVALFSLKNGPDGDPCLGDVPLNNLPLLYSWGTQAQLIVVLCAFSIGFLLLLCLIVASLGTGISQFLYDRHRWAKFILDHGEGPFRVFLVLLFLPSWCPLLMKGHAMYSYMLAYLAMSWKATWRNSCFYMPCSPQSLVDW